MSNMEVKTYTDFWSMEKKIYAIYDFSLPFPISIRTIGILLGTGVPWALLLSFLQVPLDPPLFLLYIAPPGALAFFGSKQIFEGKNILQYATSRGRFLFQSKYYKGLSPMVQTKDNIYEVSSKVWHPDNAEDIV